MTYDSLRSVFVYTGIASLVLAAVAVVLFFWLKIPEAYAYITGKARRRGIEQIIRGDSAQANAKKSGKAKSARSGQSAKKPVKQAREPVKTTAAAVVPANGGAETDLLETEQTTLLAQSSEETSLLAADLTTVLAEEHGPEQTTLLSAQEGTDELTVPVPVQPFEIEFEITYLHADPLIR